MGKRKPLIIGKILVFLRNHDLDFITLRDHKFRPHFRTDANPVDTRRHGNRTVGFDRDFKTGAVHRVDQHFIQLEQRLATGEYDIAVFRMIRRQQGNNTLCQCFCRRVFAATFTCRPDEIGITKPANGARSVFFPSPTTNCSPKNGRTRQDARYVRPRPAVYKKFPLRCTSQPLSGYRSA